jgi:hypothetical protein
VVRNALSLACPIVICIQESKLAALDDRKARSFLSQNVSAFETVDAMGSHGGIVSAWDPNVLSLTSSFWRSFSLTTCLSSTTSELSFMLTNIYAPSDHSLTSLFMEEMLALADEIPGAWLVVGDFNLIRYPQRKTTTISIVAWRRRSTP